MADKSQRNQFKKKVTTCPLLLSLFLLGAKAAKTFDPAYEYNVQMQTLMNETPATTKYYLAGTAITLATAAGATSTPAGCLAKCKADADPLKHSACEHARQYAGGAGSAATTYTDTCKLWESATAATTATYNYPFIPAPVASGMYYTAWTWNLDTQGVNPAAPLSLAQIEAKIKELVGQPYIKEEKSDASPQVITTAGQQATGLYAAIGQKSTPLEVYTTANKLQKHPAQTATGIFEYMETYIGKPFVRPVKGVCQTVGCSGLTDNGQAASGLYDHLGYMDMSAVGADSTASGYKPVVVGKGLTKAIGAPAEPKLYHTVSGSVVVNDASGADATGLYARIGGPAVASVIANAAGTLANNDKAAIPVSGLWEKIGSPAVAATAKFGIDGTATPAAAGTNTASTGLYKHIGDPAAAAIAYAAAAAGKAAVVGKIAIPASGMYKSIADKAVTSCPTEAQIKEVIKTTEPKAPADGAEARFAATLLASAAALAALV